MLAVLFNAVAGLAIAHSIFLECYALSVLLQLSCCELEMWGVWSACVCGHVLPLAGCFARVCVNDFHSGLVILSKSPITLAYLKRYLTLSEVLQEWQMWGVHGSRLDFRC